VAVQPTVNLARRQRIAYSIRQAAIRTATQRLAADLQALPPKEAAGQIMNQIQQLPPEKQQQAKREYNQGVQAVQRGQITWPQFLKRIALTLVTLGAIALPGVARGQMPAGFAAPTAPGAYQPQPTLPSPMSAVPASEITRPDPSHKPWDAGIKQPLTKSELSKTFPHGTPDPSGPAVAKPTVDYEGSNDKHRVQVLLQAPWVNTYDTPNTALRLGAQYRQALAQLKAQMRVTLDEFAKQGGKAQLVSTTDDDELPFNPENPRSLNKFVTRAKGGVVQVPVTFNIRYTIQGPGGSPPREVNIEEFLSPSGLLPTGPGVTRVP
jgi:hypothetical protein